MGTGGGEWGGVQTDEEKRWLSGVAAVGRSSSSTVVVSASLLH